jgi:hypothetical protein
MKDPGSSFQGLKLTVYLIERNYYEKTFLYKIYNPYKINHGFYVWIQWSIYKMLLTKIKDNSCPRTDPYETLQVTGSVDDIDPLTWAYVVDLQEFHVEMLVQVLWHMCKRISGLTLAKLDLKILQPAYILGLIRNLSRLSNILWLAQPCGRIWI